MFAENEKNLGKVSRSEKICGAYSFVQTQVNLAYKNEYSLNHQNRINNIKAFWNVFSSHLKCVRMQCDAHEAVATGPIEGRVGHVTEENASSAPANSA